MNSTKHFKISEVISSFFFRQIAFSDVLSMGKTETHLVVKNLTRISSISQAYMFFLWKKNFLFSSVLMGF